VGDHGLFGPGSVTWRVHASPVMLIGGLRALMIQALHPLALAGVVQQSDFRERPLHRLRRTAEYVATVTFADTATAQAAGAHVRRVHTFIKGTDPVTGRPYSAEDPETLLWVHCAEVHSFLAAYRAYGGSLTGDEQDRYLDESRRAAALVGIPPERVPGSREEMRAYFADMLPSLCVSQAASETIRFVVSPPLTRDLLPLQPPLRVIALAAVGLVPRHLRRMAGIDRPWLVDAATHAAVLPAARAVGVAMRLPLARDAQRVLLRAA
jgi:uncharacterized protein (DUF2236 family)